jgi:hypothetical protein
LSQRHDDGDGVAESRSDMFDLHARADGGSVRGNTDTVSQPVSAARERRHVDVFMHWRRYGDQDDFDRYDN